MVGLYLHFPTRLHGVVLNQLTFTVSTHVDNLRSCANTRTVVKAWSVCQRYLCYLHIYRQSFHLKLVTRECSSDIDVPNREYFLSCPVHLKTEIESISETEDGGGKIRNNSFKHSVRSISAGNIPDCGVYGRQSGNGTGFLRVLRFPRAIIIPPTSPSS
jgi:hypothetical protein